ncbi:MAG: midcut-by-XrtH protein [Betaproteobacteria bacterium]|nr:midcut-by-XrtH protein [Betaproteobacteria bacterium]
MIRHAIKFIHIAPALAFMLSGADAIAAIGTITYGPVPQSIPTLSGFMLIALGLLLAVFAFRVLRAHSASKPLASIVAVGVLVLGAASGNQLIQNAQAVIFPPPPSLFFSNPSGGVLNVLHVGETPILNNSGQPQRVISVTVSPLFVDIPTSQQSRCTIGLVVQNNSSCYMNFTFNGPSPPYEPGDPVPPA